ncbi:MAG: Gfo/Idh/MocA family protein [bacterium]
MKRDVNRREFFGITGRAAVGAGLAARGLTAASALGANEKVVMGVIGCGGQGTADMIEFTKFDGVEIAAVCDVDSQHAEAAAAECVKRDRPKPKMFKDFRQLLDIKDLDAVIIGTPDHWHALPFCLACEAGKDIYCEKPLAQNFVEAKTMLHAARRFNRVAQINTWQRTLPHFQEAIRFVRSGAMGKITVGRGWNVNPVVGWLKPIGNEKPQTPPPNLDWDFWLGPAPMVPYQSNRCHFNWRWFWDYGGGLMTDWGVHVLDIVLLGMNDLEPVEVHGVAGKYFMTDDRETPDTQQVIYRFKNWLMNWETRMNNGRGLDGGNGHGSEFIGANGTLIVDRIEMKYYPETPQVGKPKNIPGGGDAGLRMNNHVKNFLDCLKSRAQPASDIESMARVTLICMLGNMASLTGKPILWDPVNLDVKNKEDVKNSIAYERPYRAPWKLPVY